MVLARGETRYSLGSSPVIGEGLAWTEGELSSAITDFVADIVNDVEGSKLITKLLESVAGTDFDPARLQEILGPTRAAEAWRVGEAIAESYLVNHRNCQFPWPDNRDERRSGSSLPGADLVGFYVDADDIYFAFGEVKTSAEDKYPPGLVHGRTGLHSQLEDLRDKEIRREDLFKYLGHRATNAPWQNLFIKASVKYLKSSTNVRVFGILIRDVIPNDNDLKNRVEKLGESCPSDMCIELLAIYLPARSIASLPARVSGLQPGGAE